MATAVPFTRLLMNGALEFCKICWIGPLNWLAGCVQLWFSIAITITFLSSSALAERPNMATKTNRPSMLIRLRFDMNLSPKDRGIRGTGRRIGPQEGHDGLWTAD